jgi:hypothetical protein
MNTKIALFSHHYVDKLVIERFINLKKLNPSWDVKPIGFDGYDLLPESIVVNKEKYPKNKELVEIDNIHTEDWADPDLYIYDAYLQFPKYDSYFLYEYDTICNISIDEFFDTTLDFFGNNIVVPGEETWWWVEQYRKLNKNHNRFDKIYSYGQSTCIYFTNEILSKCVKELLSNKDLYSNMLSEIRGGTLVSQFTTLKRGRDDINKYISWTPTDIHIDTSLSYFYHPVK